MLTEEEKDIVSCFRSSGYQPEVMMVAVIDRLVKENEELEKSRNVWANRHLNPKVEQLESKLDAIKKAWGIVLVKYNAVADFFSFVCDEEIELGDEIKALDKLIGGGK